jgi:hypothetical protein
VLSGKKYTKGAGSLSINTDSLRVYVRLGVLLALAGCAGTQPVAEGEAGAAPADVVAESNIPPVQADDTRAQTTNDVNEALADQCEAAGESGDQEASVECDTEAEIEEPLLDRAQRTVFEVTNNTTRWFDGFFGETTLNDADHVSRGKLTTGAFWDQRDQFNARVRFRARYALPGLKQRTRLILGRGDIDDLIDGTEDPITEGLPGSFDTEQDDDWLFGFGFSRSGNTSRGFDLGVGVRLSTPLEPYIRLTYRWYQNFNDKWFLSLRPRVFAQSQRGTGLTFQTDLSRIMNEDLVIRWSNDFSLEDRVEGLGWRSDLLAYQGLSNNRGLSYGIFALGQTDAAVTLQNYGFEIRYRQRIYREWFFIQLSTGYSWPRFELQEIRESNFGVGLLFEMRFGRWDRSKPVSDAPEEVFSRSAESGFRHHRSAFAQAPVGFE